ncbi:MAG: hypothetical protein KJ998_09400 [Gammaproteobacteria bacterium]|nr:hypothetical protein [Gammaproteobacteria bacterium]
MKKWLLLALLGSSVAQANMLDALQAYGKKDYAAAAQQFAELLPLGTCGISPLVSSIPLFIIS